MTFADAWKLDSGLRENMDLTIHSAYFAPHAEYQGGRVLLLFLLGNDENGDPQEIRMSIGSDWQTADGGRTVTHPTKKHINKSTIYGHWINACMEVPELASILYNHPSPTDASVWVNMILRLQLKSIHFGKNIDDQERLMPVAYLGQYSDDAPQAPPVPPQPLTPPPVAATVPVAPSPAPATPASNGSPLFAQVHQLALTSADFPTFLSSAFALPGVLADEELAQQVADQGQIWASIKGN